MRHRPLVRVAAPLRDPRPVSTFHRRTPPSRISHQPPLPSLYYNCDVVASLTDITMTQLSTDVVRVTGVRGLPPPPTTKVGITLPGGFQAEWHIWLCGLDLAEKIQMTKDQILYTIGADLPRFTKLQFQQMGSSVCDGAPTQDVATVDLRIFAQTRDPELLRADVPRGFNRWVLETFLQSAPVCTRVVYSSVGRGPVRSGTDASIYRARRSATILGRWHRSRSTSTGWRSCRRRSSASRCTACSASRACGSCLHRVSPGSTRDSRSPTKRGIQCRWSRSARRSALL